MKHARRPLLCVTGEALRPAFLIARRSQPRCRCGNSLVGAGLSGHSAMWSQRAHVHESPFMELPQDISRGEAYEMARDALLQLNVMIRRGIEPDVLMYTSMIDTMGRAGLEWQAYKLFSRMVEQNVRPLPETYVALRDATSKSRVKLREDIQAKIEETMDMLPQELAEDVAARQREEDRQCIAKFNEYMRGDVEHIGGGVGSNRPSADTPAGAACAQATSSGSSEGAKGTGDLPGASADDASRGTPVATMRIRNPTDVWNTARLAEEVRGAPQSKASGTAADDLRIALSKLHSEELRIYLAAQRQLRHGRHEELVDRVLGTVSERAIRDMLARRQHYFRSVEEILGNDLRELRMDQAISGTQEEAPRAPQKDRATAHERDRTLSEAEKEDVAPEVLHTPWGILRKPSRPSAEPPAPRNSDRLERVRLSEPELVLVRSRAESKELDELPESLLRRYAYQFQLRWRRRDPLSLLEAVQWHATTFIPQDVLTAGESAGVLPSANPTPPVRLQQEDEGMHRTLDNFDAFRIISQRTNNLQVVDNKEINLQVKRVRQEAQKKEKRAEERFRRERNVMAAAGLAASARTLTLPPDDEISERHILGIDNQGRPPSFTAEKQLPDAQTPPAVEYQHEETPVATTDANPVEELPPWALFDGEDEFNLTTGRFGSADVGRYRELSDSKFQVMPSRAAQQQWSVDRHLMPSTLQDVVRHAELEMKSRYDSIEREYEGKLQYKRYKKWDQMIQKAQDKKRRRRGDTRSAEGEEDAEAVKPLPPRRRLSQVLRKGSDRDRVSKRVREKYNRSL